MRWDGLDGHAVRWVRAGAPVPHTDRPPEGEELLHIHEEEAARPQGVQSGGQGVQAGVEQGQRACGGARGAGG